MGKKRLRDLGFDIPKDGKLTARQALMLNKTEEELPSTSFLDKADEIELQEIMDNVARSMEDLITQLRDHTQTQTNDSLEHPLRELLGFDKKLRSIRGSLKVETVKKVQLEQNNT